MFLLLDIQDKILGTLVRNDRIFRIYVWTSTAISQQRHGYEV